MKENEIVPPLQDAGWELRVSLGVPHPVLGTSGDDPQAVAAQGTSGRNPGEYIRALSENAQKF